MRILLLLALALPAPAQTLVSMAVSPAPVRTTVGGATVSFTCVSTFSDNSTAACASPVWASGTTATATINSSTGVASPVAVGETLITATIGSVSGHVNLIVGSGVKWYARLDGGNQTQCTGHANAAYPGGSGQACAYNDQYLFMNISTGTWNVAAGDDVIVVDGGPFYFGEGFGGLGTTYPFCAGIPRNCGFPPFPNYVSYLGPPGKSKIIMLNGLNEAFFMDGSQGVELGNFEITQPDTCGINGGTFATITNTSKTGTTGTYAFDNGNPASLGFVPSERINVSGTTNGGGVFNISNTQIATLSGVQGSFGQYTSGTFTITGLPSGTVTSASESGSMTFAGQCVQGVNNFGRDGILITFATDQGPSNSYVHDLNIHGLADDGFKGSHYNIVDTDTMYFSNILFDGNGESGMDADSGSGGTSQESVGDIYIDTLTAIWNGCQKVSPGVYNYCVDQAFNGNGDGIVNIATKGRWHYTHIDTELNAQDGFDSLHFGDDLTAFPTLNVFDIYAYGNEGQALKGGGGFVTFQNFIGITNCAVFATASNFPSNPPGWNATVGETCRASDSTAFAMTDGDTLTLQNGTIISDQATSIDLAAAGGGDCTGGCIAKFQNVSTFGFISPPQSPNTGNFPGGLFIGTSVDPFLNVSSSIMHNNWFQMKNGCPQDASETNAVCTNPTFTAQASIAAMNVVPLTGSPLIGAGITITPPLTRDFFNVPYSSPPPIGAAMPAGVVASPSQLKGKVICTGKCTLK